MTSIDLTNAYPGDVPVPEDPREIAAAHRAGDISYRLYPYFDWRYGARGRRFARSDSAWLAWLTRHEQTRVIDQVRWLGSVLSNRGMPRLLLETHLRVLYKQLAASNSDKSAEYEKLLTASNDLRALRRAVISEDAIALLANDFAQAFNGISTRLLYGTGRLLVCAVADRRSDCKRAVDSLLEWLEDAERLRTLKGLRKTLCSDLNVALDAPEFPSRWRSALHATVRGAEEAIKVAESGARISGRCA